MIPAADIKWFKKIWYFYNRHYLLRRHFSAIQLRGNIDPASDGQSPPIIFIANHSNWWDGLLAYDAYFPRTKYRHYVMMDERQLRQFRFFSRLGVFSIDKTKLSAIMESLQYASDLLDSGHAVWIFPQGDIEHPEKRPLQFSSGVSYLLQKCPHALVVPVSLYYCFCHYQKPEASIWFGEAISHQWNELERKQITEMLQIKLEFQLDEHRNVYMAGNRQVSGFVEIFRAKSTDERFVRFKKWVKAWFTYSRRSQ